MLSVAVMARFCSDDNAICYVLLVLWMTSRLLIIGQTEETLIGRILKVTHQRVEPGAKSDVDD